MLKDFKRHIAAIVIFLVSFITGLSAFEDFGISWDEPNQRTTGLIAYNYVFAGDTVYKTYINRDYGVAFQLPLILLEKLIDTEDPRHIYNFRKLVNHLFFLFSAFIFYMLIYYLYKKRSLAIAGYLLLLFTPRIYAQSFFNTKDIPFMCMFIICFFLCAVAFRTKKVRHFLFFGAGTGLLMSIRVMGVLLPAFVTLMVIIDFLWGKDKKKTAISFLCYLFSSVAVLIISWPFLWENPVGNFTAAFSHMARFRWDKEVLILGEVVRSTKVSWAYVPEWFGLTTPVPYLLLGVIGIIILVLNFFRKPVRFLMNTPDRNQLLYIVFFFGPVLSVIILHSVLYDGWRQLYFVYPPFILLAVYGFSCLLYSKTQMGNLLPTMAGVVLFFSVLTTASIMIRNHPFEDVYFNSLVPSEEQYLRKSFELDYWGTSYKQALEYIVSHDKSGMIWVTVAHPPGEANAMILKEKDRKRIRFTDNLGQATYFISTYRWHPQDYEWRPEQKVFNIKIMNSDICSVWKIKKVNC
jgi:hypothetical protein